MILNNHDFESGKKNEKKKFIKDKHVSQSNFCYKCFIMFSKFFGGLN